MLVDLLTKGVCWYVISHMRIALSLTVRMDEHWAGVFYLDRGSIQTALGPGATNVASVITLLIFPVSAG